MLVSPKHVLPELEHIQSLCQSGKCKPKSGQVRLQHPSHSEPWDAGKLRVPIAHIGGLALMGNWQGDAMVPTGMGPRTLCGGVGGSGLTVAGWGLLLSPFHPPTP
jgi:hypothetical protein